MDITTGMQIHVKILYSITILEMTQMYRDPNIKASIIHTEIIDDKLLIATDKNIQLLYLLRPNPNTNETNKINVVFIRRYNISEHFKPYKIEGSQDRQESRA